MKNFLFVCLIIGPLNLMAETLATKVHSYDEEHGFFRFENGRVAFTRKNEKSLSAIYSLWRGQSVEVNIDENNELTSISRAEDSQEFLSTKSISQDPPVFTPTVLPSYAAAVAMFNRFRPDYKRLSECTDRAHVWAYDEFKANGIFSEKVFALFTASYINRNHFKWWFHVAPLVSVNEGGAITKKVMDFRYTDHPMPIKEWTDMLVFSKRECKMTTKFSEYDVNPQTEDCYMIIDSMYNRMPGDLSNQETIGQYRSDFSESEVRASRGYAFESRGAP